MISLGMTGLAEAYTRTGQYEKAAGVIDRFGRNRFWFERFYFFFWRGDHDRAREYYRTLGESSDLEPLERYWVHFLLEEFDRGLDYLEEDVRRGAHPAVFRSNIDELLPESSMRTLESLPRYQALLQTFGIDDAWRAELQSLADELRPLTGILVRGDDD
jgi:hypothetical protein